MQEPVLGDKDLMIVGNYVDTVKDIINMAKTTKRNRGLPDLYRKNPVPLHNDKEWQLFPNIETYTATSETDLRSIVTTRKRPYYLKVIKMDFTATIDKKPEFKRIVEEQDMKLIGDYSAPLTEDMDEDLARQMSLVDKARMEMKRRREQQ